MKKQRHHFYVTVTGEFGQKRGGQKWVGGGQKSERFRCGLGIVVLSYTIWLLFSRNFGHYLYIAKMLNYEFPAAGSRNFTQLRHCSVAYLPLLITMLCPGLL